MAYGFLVLNLLILVGTALIQYFGTHQYRFLPIYLTIFLILAIGNIVISLTLFKNIESNDLILWPNVIYVGLVIIFFIVWKVKVKDAIASPKEQLRKMQEEADDARHEQELEEYKSESKSASKSKSRQKELEAAKAASRAQSAKAESAKAESARARSAIEKLDLEPIED
jgi:Sec-independent protein translocase protein TatA